jgi:hypothetical protein
VQTVSLPRMVSSGLLRRVALVRTDVSEEPGASFSHRRENLKSYIVSLPDQITISPGPFYIETETSRMNKLCFPIAYVFSLDPLYFTGSMLVTHPHSKPLALHKASNPCSAMRQRFRGCLVSWESEEVTGSLPSCEVRIHMTHPFRITRP